MPIVRKAVILAAGLGTRMLPATRAVPKELLPVVDRPTIQYAVEECAEAGIEDVVFVIADGKEAIAEHFGTRTRADAYVLSHDDPELRQMVQAPAQLARFHYVRQDEPRGIAHAVACAREIVKGEPFALIFPDDVIVGARSCIGQLAEAYAATNGTVLAVQHVPARDIPQYGIVDPVGGGNPMRLKGVVEKPAAVDAPSSLGIVGRYILGESIFSHIDRTPPGKNGELQITDAIAGQIAAGETVSGYQYEGVRYDTGRPLGYLAANIGVALGRDDLRGPLAARLREMLGEGAG